MSSKHMSTTEEWIEIEEHIVDRVTKITKKKKRRPGPKQEKAQQDKTRSMFSQNVDQIRA